jgi:hypothetical protein
MAEPLGQLVEVIERQLLVAYYNKPMRMENLEDLPHDLVIDRLGEVHP